MESPRRRDRCAANAKHFPVNITGGSGGQTFSIIPPLYGLAGTKSRFSNFALRVSGENIVIGKHYFTRQATTLLMLAKSTTDANVAAALIDKAADLKSRLDESAVPDLTPLAPDIEPPT